MATDTPKHDHDRAREFESPRPPGAASGEWATVNARDIVSGSITYDPTTDCYRVRHDPDGNAPIGPTVAAAAAVVVDADPVATRPLAEVIDPDALERLFDPPAGDGPLTGSLTFRYLGCEVSVDADGMVSIRPPATGSN